MTLLWFKRLLTENLIVVVYT